jgi:hypothetical protein
MGHRTSCYCGFPMRHCLRRARCSLSTSCTCHRSARPPVACPHPSRPVRATPLSTSGLALTRDISDILTAEGFTVSRNQVELNQPIKAIGLTNVAIALHPEVEVTITLNIARSAEEAERQSKGEMLTTAEAIYGDDINENARPDNFFDPNSDEDGENA